jgi:hypothetical protein
VVTVEQFKREAAARSIADNHPAIVRRRTSSRRASRWTRSSRATSPRGAPRTCIGRDVTEILDCPAATRRTAADDFAAKGDRGSCSFEYDVSVSGPSVVTKSP